MLQIDMKNNQSEFESNERPSSTKDEHKKSPSLFKQMKDDFFKGENAFRSNMETFMIKNGKWLVQIVAIMAFVVTLLYIAITYLDNVQYPTIISAWYLKIEKGVVIAMLIMYILNWYINPDRLSYVYASSDSIIALICILPILSFEDMTMRNPLFAIIGISRYFRIYYFMKIILQHVDLGQNEVDQSIYKSILTIMTIIIISAGIFAEIENGANIEIYEEKSDGSGEWIMSYKDTDGFQPLNFHDSFYFVMVTLSTVGYGDINPTTEQGQVISLIMLLITMIYVPTQTSELLRLVSIKSKYRTAVYPGSESDHVVVTGHVGINAIQNFCDELFHEEHNNSGQQKNAVLVQDHDPIPEIDIFVQKYEKLMYYLAGDPLDSDSMKRADAHNAEVCILLTDKNSKNSSEEDYRNILIALSIKKFVYDQMKDQCNVRLCMQLIKPESKHLYYKSVKLSPLRDQLIIVEEIKMNLLAKSCFAPGLIAMISNLIASASEIDHEEGEEEVKEWFKEYTEGMGHEIYRVEIQKSIFPDRVTFKKIAEVGFSEFRSIVFALEIQSFDQQKSIIRLNPNCFEFTDWDHFKYYIYIICESDEDAKKLELLSMNDDSFQRTFGVPRMTLKLNSPEQEKSIQTAKKGDSLNNQPPEEEETQKLMNATESKSNPDAENISAKENKKNKDHNIGGFDTLKFLNEDEGNEEQVLQNKKNDEEFYKDYDRHPKKQTQMDVSEESQLLGLKDHIVVCGFHSSIQHFILPLRAKYLDKKKQQIVIITPIKTIPEEIWNSINRFPQIYLKNGSPLEIETLRAAQLHKADKAVILGHDPTTDNSNELNDEMLDAQSIFIYKALKKCNPYIKVFTEMSFSSNIDFLMDRNSNQDKDLSFQHSTLYAAGEVYISTLIDTLTAQAIYNQNIVTILQQILVGRTTSFYPKFEEGVVNHFGAKLQQANLWQIHVPEEMNNKTFDKLYKFLLDKGMVTLGLYRLPGANENQYPYVFTNPNQKIALTNRDRVFVVGCSNDIPQEMIIDASKERAEMAIQDGAGIITDNQGDPSDGKKNEKNQKSVKQGHKTSSQMPNQKDFYGLNILPSPCIESALENDQTKGDSDANDDYSTNSNRKDTKGSKSGSKTDNGQIQDPKGTAQAKTPLPELNSTNSIEIIKQAVDDLKRRVDHIETKINDVEKTLNNQNTNIRTVVFQEKNKFLSQLDP